MPVTIPVRAEKSTAMVVVENFGTCNMRCTYCFPEHMWEREGITGVIPEATYRGVLERTFASTSAPTVDVHLAGGEPLLAGRSWLEMALDTAREIGDRYGKQVTFSLQTNATLVTNELAELLAANNVNVGVSIDGDAEINEAVRGKTAGTLAGFRRLKAAMRRTPGVITTVTRCNARRMEEVIDYLDSLGVLMFRANQMGATASWNAHAAPRAEEWAAAHRDILTGIAARRGRIMEFNLAGSVAKLVNTLIGGDDPFGAHHGCGGMRCPAGRGLMYFDQKGNAYPCPRANVTEEARIGHYADADFDERWDDNIRELDAAMTVPAMCRRCPAQVVCDYGCHAFNVAQGNYFEVNCDATKEYFDTVVDRLEDVSRVYLLLKWREARKRENDREAVMRGVDLPDESVSELAGRLRRALDCWLAEPHLDLDLLRQRFGWRESLIPVATLTRRPRPESLMGATLPKGGGDRTTSDT